MLDRLIRKRDDAPIEVLEIGEENQYRGRCLTCGLAVEGDLLLRTVIETLHTMNQRSCSPGPLFF
jgi:hypothetical protein